MKRLLYRTISLVMVMLLSQMAGVTAVLAQSASTNYKVDEYYFGLGGELDPSSASYKSKQSSGELGQGNASSSNYQTQGGYNTTGAPYLEFYVNNSTVNLGTLSTSAAATGTGTFWVRAYLAGGYSVRTVSDPPSYGGHTISTPSSPTASAAGTEQFGMNLVANTSPTTFGANPSQNPDSSFSFGTAASGYDQVNQFKYTKNDTVAQSTKSSGRTDYTISYIFNISNVTPGGTYTFNQNLVVTATY